MTSMSPDEKKAAREYSSVLLALQFGALLLTPSIRSIIEPPYSVYWMLLTYYIVAIISIVLLGAVYYKTYMPNPENPTKAQGLSTHALLLSLLLFIVFFGINIVDDRKQPPTFEDIAVSNLSPKPGELLKLSVQTKGIASDDNIINWEIDGKVVSTKNFVFISIPNNATNINIEVEVSNTAGKEKCTLEIPVHQKPKDGEDNGRTAIETPAAESADEPIKSTARWYRCQSTGY